MEKHPKNPRLNRYSTEEQDVFCETARAIGIGRAMREHGYPQSYMAAITWLNARGIEPNVDKDMARIRSFHTYYQAEDLIIAFDNAVAVAEEMISKAETPEDLSRIANALNKIVQSRNLIEGKATAINEKREITQQDLEIAELLNMEKAKNQEIENANNSTSASE